VNHDGVWENRAIYVYYSELLFEISALTIDLCHHLHMLVRSVYLLNVIPNNCSMENNFLQENSGVFTVIQMRLVFVSKGMPAVMYGV